MLNPAYFLTAVLMVCACMPLPVRATDNPFTLKSKNIVVSLGQDGKLRATVFDAGGHQKKVIAFTEIQSFVSVKNSRWQSPDKKTCRLQQDLYSDSLKTHCTVVETFQSTATGIRWQASVTGGGEDFSANIQTVIQYPVSADTRFWTSWGQPSYDSTSADPALVNRLYPYKNKSPHTGWMDPLIPMPFTNTRFYYGAPPFDYADVKDGFIPFQGNLFSIPFATVMDAAPDRGLSIFLSPADSIVNLSMETTAKGSIRFSRQFNRISKHRQTRFSLDLTVHAPDWRAALQSFAQEYPSYCEPVLASAAKLGGTAAYSNFFDDFDAAKMKRMAFTVNWQASFDFPYMGMFLPPLSSDRAWRRFGGGTMTIRRMDDYARRMKEKGFAVLSYFNVTEFGSAMVFPDRSAPVASSDIWKEPGQFLAKHFPAAMLIAADEVDLKKLVDSNTYHGGPYYSWKGAVAMDCGDTAYQHFLLGQAYRLVHEIPNAAGICIDRLDWLRFVNQHADDQITWFRGRPARALVSSWKALMKKMGPLMHDAGKAIFVNNHDKRIDLLDQVDGVLDEFTQATSPLNLTAFLTLYKPALGWTPGKEVIDADGGDHFFQKYLYLAVFPMCPFPGNDHALLPDSAVDQLYLDYGPLMNQLKEKRWVLRPGILEITGSDARANIFQTKSGYSIPVVYGSGRQAVVTVNDAGIARHSWNCLVYLPGRTEARQVQAVQRGNILSVTVPLERGAAMLVLSDK